METKIRSDIVNFPSTENLDTSEISGDIIYGGSIAINRILGRIRDSSNSSGDTWRLWMINLYTVLEGIVDLDKSEVTMSDEFEKDLDLLITYISAYLSQSSLPQRGVGTICLYSPTYNIPESLSRKFKSDTKAAAVRARLDKFYRKLITNEFGLGVKPLSDSQSDIRIWFVPVGNSALPHRELYRWASVPVKDPSHLIGRDASVIITHCPIDLHIHRLISKLSLVERYTGSVVLPAAFGKKLDKCEHVPFNIYTHHAFGDKVHIEGILGRKDKAVIRKIAEERNWPSLSQDLILEHMAKETGIRASEFLKLKL